MDSRKSKKHKELETIRSSGGKLVTQYILKFLTLYGAIYSHGQKMTAPSGQTPPRWQVLGAVEAAPLTMSQVARRMGMTRQGVRRVAKLLAEDRLISFEENPDHATAHRIVITQKGIETLTAIHSIQVRWANEIAKHISKNDLEVMNEGIDAFATALKRSEKILAKET